MKKGEVTIKILEFLVKSAETSFDIVDAILSSGYGASYGRMRYRLKQNQSRRDMDDNKRKRLQNCRNILFKLKQDGLVVESKRGEDKIISITHKGKLKLANLKLGVSHSKNFPDPHYDKEKQSFFTIVVFDIPEKERRSRDWLRAVLKNLGLQLIQKSVWIGKIKIPKELLDDIFRLKLENFIEIFEISKAGSLKQLT